MKAQVFLIGLAVISGMLLPMQAAFNARVGKAIGDPVYAALVSFVLGSIGLLIYCLVQGI
jgi:transporter family-2 protein